jgi:hypothetical protein
MEKKDLIKSGDMITMMDQYTIPTISALVAAEALMHRVSFNYPVNSSCNSNSRRLRISKTILSTQQSQASLETQARRRSRHKQLSSSSACTYQRWI